MGALALARIDPLNAQCLELDELRVLKSGHCRRQLLNDVCNPLSGEARVCMAMHTHRLELERDSKPWKVALKDHIGSRYIDVTTASSSRVDPAASALVIGGSVDAT